MRLVIISLLKYIHALISSAGCSWMALMKMWKSICIKNTCDPIILCHYFKSKVLRTCMCHRVVTNPSHRHNVPNSFDHLTVDIDMNTPWVLRELLFAKYRPRSVTVEYNRNFHSQDAYIAINAPSTDPNGCWFGASGLALERIMQAFDYSLVAFDQQGSMCRCIEHNCSMLTKHLSYSQLVFCP